MNTPTNIPKGAAVPPVEAEEATATSMTIGANPNVNCQQHPAGDCVMHDIDDMSIDEDSDDDDLETLKKHAQRALERARVAQKVHTKALREQAKFIEFHSRKPEVPMTEAAITRERQLESHVTATEDELKQAKLQHQRLYQAYRDLIMQDQELNSDTVYLGFGKRTTTSKQEKVVGIKPDRTDIKHQALQSIFGLKIIPVQENLKEIDFSRVGRKDFPGAPFLELDVTSTDRDARLLEVVKTIEDFLEDLAARYMIDALKSNELAEMFEQALARPGYKSNNWEDVQACVRSVFKMDNFQTELRGKLLTIKPYPQEGVYEYTQRIKTLVKGSGVEPKNQEVIMAIANTLSDQGKEKLISEYTEDLQVPSINVLIDFMTRNPMVLTGDRSDPLNWVIMFFNKRRTGNSEKDHASHSGSSSGSSNTMNRDSNNKGSSHHGATGKSLKYQKKRYDAYQRPMSKTVGSDGNRLTLLIIINGMEFRALVDPGSTMSAHSQALLESSEISGDDTDTVHFLDKAYTVSSISKEKVV
ncbi:hypothetical protein BGX26_002485 [Mortierella sp. AD094]|nr:hypothetical protein BGX26_002485 [Mortierella sp. AD094]